MLLCVVMVFFLCNFLALVVNILEVRVCFLWSALVTALAETSDVAILLLLHYVNLTIYTLTSPPPHRR
jgi:hypothetical protein